MTDVCTNRDELEAQAEAASQWPEPVADERTATYMAGMMPDYMAAQHTREEREELAKQAAAAFAQGARLLGFELACGFFDTFAETADCWMK
jgi:hypothetical protein